METLKRLVFFIGGICLLIACSKSDQYNSGLFMDNDLKNTMSFVEGDVLHFSGKTVYKYVQVIGDNVLADMYCPNEATITSLGNNKIELYITENGDCGGRSFFAYGLMTPSGSITFEYAVPVLYGMNITDVIRGHLGCDINGPGISKNTLLFQGKFDGSKLVAMVHFIAKCNVHWEANNIFTTPVEGPVKCSWTYELTLDN